MRLSQWIMAILAVGAFVVLCGLGTWQVKRLQWKEALIARIHDRIARPSAELDALMQDFRKGSELDYHPVTARGTFLHDREVYYYNTNRGFVGWNVITPMRLEDGRYLLVNRGFVPEANREPGSRAAGQITGPIELTGLVRLPPVEKPNSFMPENDPKKNQFFWKDHPAMAQKAGLKPDDQIIPFFIDTGKSDIPGGLPEGGTTRVTFPNNHLQYAITWFGIAGTLVLVAGFYVVSTRKKAIAHDA